MEIGNWLKVNGEAIYGTRAYIRSKDDEKINSSTGKDLFFTRKGRDLYVICTSWPGNNIILKDLRSRGNVKISMLGTDKPVDMKSSGGNTVIVPPGLSPDDYQPAYVFKLTNILK